MEIAVLLCAFPVVHQNPAAWRQAVCVEKQMQPPRHGGANGCGLVNLSQDLRGLLLDVELLGHGLQGRLPGSLLMHSTASDCQGTARTKPKII